MLRRSHYIALGGVILLTLVILKLPGRTATQLKAVISSFFLPLQGLAGSGRKVADKASDTVVPRRQLLEQMEYLQKENQALRVKVMQAEEALRENARLRQALGILKESPWKLRLARVVGRDPANWWRNLKIGLGSRDGVVNNAPVIAADGASGRVALVGRVSEVGLAQSRVVLLGDADCRVSVLIEDKESRDHGVIAPSSQTPLDFSMVEIGCLSRNTPLRAGQAVVTSGEGGIFPKGILVGHIVDWREVGYGLYKEARVSLVLNMNALEEVWVVLP